MDIHEQIREHRKLNKKELDLKSLSEAIIQESKRLSELYERRAFGHISNKQYEIAKEAFDCSVYSYECQVDCQNTRLKIFEVHQEARALAKNEAIDAAKKLSERYSKQHKRLDVGIVFSAVLSCSLPFVLAKIPAGKLFYDDLDKFEVTNKEIALSSVATASGVPLFLGFLYASSRTNRRYDKDIKKPQQGVEDRKNEIYETLKDQPIWQPPSNDV